MRKDRLKTISQCGREITVQEINDIKEMIVLCKGLSRRELVETVSENLEWFTASGSNKIDACAKLLDKLESNKIIELPPKVTKKKYKKKAICKTEKTAPQPDIICELKDLGEIKLEIVKDKIIKDLWNEYVFRYHYLGYKKPFGYTLRYFIRSDQGLLGCFLFSGASRAIGARDRWIGWTEKQRLNNLAWVINNSRFLIFPWVNVKNLASNVLGSVTRQIRRDWQEKWNYSPVLLETFVDPLYYKGSCYKASNWVYLGRTTGQGLVRKGKTYTTSPKEIFVKPLTKSFRKVLCSDKSK